MPRHWKESFIYAAAGGGEIDLVLHYNRKWFWWAWLCLFNHILSLFALYQTNRFGWLGWLDFNINAAIHAVLYGFGGLSLLWIFSLPLLRCDERGLSTLFGHLPWSDLGRFETHWSQNLAGKSYIVAVRFFKANGKKWRTIYLMMAYSQEREELLRALQNIAIPAESDALLVP